MAPALLWDHWKISVFYVNWFFVDSGSYHCCRSCLALLTGNPSLVVAKALLPSDSAWRSHSVQAIVQFPGPSNCSRCPIVLRYPVNTVLFREEVPKPPLHSSRRLIVPYLVCARCRCIGIFARLLGWLQIGYENHDLWWRSLVMEVFPLHMRLRACGGGVL